MVPRVPEEHHTVAVASFHPRRERRFLFSPFSIRGREVIAVYITLVELLMFVSLLIALAEYFDNRRDK